MHRYVFGGENSPKFPVVHLHYLQHFGASGYSKTYIIFNLEISEKNGPIVYSNRPKTGLYTLFSDLKDLRQFVLNNFWNIFSLKQKMFEISNSRNAKLSFWSTMNMFFFLWKTKSQLKKNVFWNQTRLIFDRAIGAGRTANYADYRLA